MFVCVSVFLSILSEIMGPMLLKLGWWVSEKVQVCARQGVRFPQGQVAVHLCVFLSTYFLGDGRSYVYAIWWMGVRKIVCVFVRWFDGPVVRLSRSKVRSNFNFIRLDLNLVKINLDMTGVLNAH